MEEDFELISKEKLGKILEENKKLKEQSSKPAKVSATSKTQNTKLIKKIVSAIQKESQNERDLIVENLNEIKEINKNTLDNLLTRTQDLDGKLESMVETVSDLVDSLKTVVHKLTDFEEDSIKEEVKKIEKLNLGEKLSDTNSKLGEIELFMKNLRVLLSYVKPYEIRLDIPVKKNQVDTMMKPQFPSNNNADVNQKKSNTDSNNIVSNGSNQQSNTSNLNQKNYANPNLNNSNQKNIGTNNINNNVGGGNQISQKNNVSSNLNNR